MKTLKQKATNGGWLQPEYIEACKQAGVQPTRRQWSKYRSGYGALARALGVSNRRTPPG